VIEGEPFEVWGGEQRRDLLYVDDAAEAFLYAAVTPMAEGLALNVGGDEPYSLAALAEAIIEANGGGKYEIREFPPERKRIDIGDFLTDDSRFRGSLRLVSQDRSGRWLTPFTRLLPRPSEELPVVMT